MWDGEPSTLEEFTEACLRYEQTVVREKRYLCGPRIANELKGPAKRTLLGRPADWLSYDGGVRRLIEELRIGRGQPKVPEMSELLMRYFKGTRRSKGETMGDYVTKKAEAYTRAQQSMPRYLKEKGIKDGQGGGSWWRTTTPRARSQASETPYSQPGDRWEVYSRLGDEGDHQELEAVAEHQEMWEQRSQGYRGDDWWNRADYRGWGRSNHSYDTTEWAEHQLPEILPDFIQGWYLFTDSGLDVMEKNVLQAELRGDFSVKAVSSASKTLARSGPQEKRC